MLRDQKNNNFDEERMSQFYDDFPFKSYDEILAARKRAHRYRKMCVIVLVLALFLVPTTIFIGVYGGSAIAKRFVNAILPAEGATSIEGGSSEKGGKDKDGFQVILNSPEKNTESLITTYDVSGVVKKAQQSVVGILSESYSSFSTTGYGSGIVMSEGGYIVTNYHVISDGDNITVVLNDGTNCAAYLIGFDAMTDIAVLKIHATGLTPAEFGDSDYVTIGEPAIAIGNPGGMQLQGTVTAGIISATDRELMVSDNLMHLIQTDASINPGNSGGPLLNKYGQVIAVTSSKITAVGYEGLGFAIPINTVKPIVEELVDTGFVSGRPLIGIKARVVSQLAATFYGLPRGLMVDAVMPESPIAEAGLQPNDIITHINGSAVKTISDVCSIRNQYKAGDKISLSYYRDGIVYDVEFKLAEQRVDNMGYDF